MSFEQSDRLIRMVKGPLGPDEVLVTGFSGHEAISQLFSFKIDFLSTQLDLKPEKLVGKAVGLEVDRRDSQGAALEPHRYFDGYISRLTAGDVTLHDTGNFKYRSYQAEMVPWLWFLTRAARCFIFFPEKEDKTVFEIVESVLTRAKNELQIKGAEFDLSGVGDLKQRKLKHCVQYRETDYHFLSRILEQYGAYFYFKHDGEACEHELVLSTQKNYPTCVESEVPFGLNTGSQTQADHITSWEHEYEFVSGKWEHTDYNFEKPTTSLKTGSAKIAANMVAETANFEIYDFPGEYRETSEGDKEARIRQEQEEIPHDVVRASSTCRTFTAGFTFQLKDHPGSDVVSEHGRHYLLTSIHHQANQALPESGVVVTADYVNHFACIPEQIQYRPRRITSKPIVAGIQTAVIVGPAGEEIYTDSYGRVKAQFHWDRAGTLDENSSCWIRVSQKHAGQGWGAIDLPRIGEEVVVDFEEGDPDRPMIVGRVYHAKNIPPYPLPDSKNISGMKSNSTKGGGGYNEYIFDDTKGKELIREHAERDKDSTIERDLREHVFRNRSRDVRNNETVYIGVNRCKTIGKDETVTIKNDRTETVMNDEMITVLNNRTEMVGVNETVTVGSMRSLTVGANNTETVGAVSTETVGAAKVLTVGAAYQISLGGVMNVTVAGFKAEEVGVTSSETVGSEKKIDAGDKISLQAGSEIELKTGASSIKMDSGGKIEIAGTDVTLKAGAGTVHIDPGGIITIKGPMVKINS